MSQVGQQSDLVFREGRVGKLETRVPRRVGSISWVVVLDGQDPVLSIRVLGSDLF